MSEMVETETGVMTVRMAVAGYICAQRSNGSCTPQSEQLTGLLHVHLMFLV